MELTGKLTYMIERSNRYGWAKGPKAFEYDKAQVQVPPARSYVGAGQAAGCCLRTMPVLVEAG
jgi:hypothetical protein